MGVGSSLGVLVLAGCLVLAVRAWPMASEALAGRRLEEALRQRRAAPLLELMSTSGRLAEVRQALSRLGSQELVALGDDVLTAVETERGAALLAAVADVLEARRQVEARWQAIRQGGRAEVDGAGGGAGIADGGR